MRPALLLLLPALLAAPLPCHAAMRAGAAQTQAPATLTPPRLKSSAGPSLDVQAMMDAKGAFAYCLADNLTAMGRKVAIAQSPRDELTLIFTIPGGGFAPDRKYDLTLRLDDQNPRAVRALARDAQTLLLQMGVNRPLAETLAQTRQISLSAVGAPAIAFALPPMAPVMEALQNCQKENAPAVAAPQQPAPMQPQAAPAQRPTPAPAKPAPQAAAGFPQPLAQLLDDAGLTNFQPLSMDDIPAAQRPADYIWQLGDIMGGVRERALPAGHTLSELMGIHLQGLKEKCAGAFKSEIDREHKQGALTLRTALASCAPPKGQKGDTIAVGLTFYLTRKNVMAVFTHEGPAQAKQDILAARDKIARHLLALAAQEK